MYQDGGRYVVVTEACHSFIRNKEVFCNSECQSSLSKRDFQVFVNEINSMTETINILREELIHGNRTCLSIPNTYSHYCCML